MPTLQLESFVDTSCCNAAVFMIYAMLAALKGYFSGSGAVPSSPPRRLKSHGYPGQPQGIVKTSRGAKKGGSYPSGFRLSALLGIANTVKFICWLRNQNTGKARVNSAARSETVHYISMVAIESDSSVAACSRAA